MDKLHIALFSQTGQEIANIAKKTGRYPDLVITNKDSLEGISDDILEHTLDLVMIPNKPTVEEYYTAFNILKNATKDNCIITLHGYLRVIPEEICNAFNIYNGHPGAIGLFPELRGHNPQVRSLKYPKIGSVIHKVTSVVDEGPILYHKEIINNCKTTDEVILALRDVSSELWINFLHDIL